MIICAEVRRDGTTISSVIKQNTCKAVGPGSCILSDFGEIGGVGEAILLVCECMKSLTREICSEYKSDAKK